MSTPPRRVEIEASMTTQPALDPQWIAVKMEGPGVHVVARPRRPTLAYFHVRNAREARETMQHVTGVLDDLREYAESQERASNAAANATAARNGWDEQAPEGVTVATPGGGKTWRADPAGAQAAGGAT